MNSFYKFKIKIDNLKNIVADDLTKIFATLRPIQSGCGWTVPLRADKDETFLLRPKLKTEVRNFLKKQDHPGGGGMQAEGNGGGR
jgi:hypothetical protein